MSDASTLFRKDAETLLAALPALNVQSSPPDAPRLDWFDIWRPRDPMQQVLGLDWMSTPMPIAQSAAENSAWFPGMVISFVGRLRPFQVFRGAGDGEIRAAKGLPFSQQTLKRCIARCPLLEVCNAAESYPT